LRRYLPHYCTAQTHENIWIRKQISDIFCSNRRTGISCDNRQKYESKWKIHFSVACVSKKIYETRTDELHTAWINQGVSSLGVDKERDFHPAVSSFHQTTKKTK